MELINFYKVLVILFSVQLGTFHGQASCDFSILDVGLLSLSSCYPQNNFGPELPLQNNLIIGSQLNG